MPASPGGPGRGRGVALLSLKGGVGKTTVTLGLAGAAWAVGQPVLVVDLDPQANATLALDPLPFDFTVHDVLWDGRPGIAAQALTGSAWGPGVQVLASEAALADRGQRSLGAINRLAVALTGVVDPATLLLIDCPPTLGELTRNALQAADRALVVAEASRFGVDAALRAVAAVEQARRTTNPELAVAGVVVNRVRPGQRDRWLAELARELPSTVLPFTIPEVAAVADLQEARQPVQAWPAHDSHELTGAFAELHAHLLAC